MDRRHFFAITGVSVASGCTGRKALVEEKDSSGTGSARLRSYPPVTQLSPLGHRVIHDRSTYLEQYKYENWEAGRDWKDEAALWITVVYQLLGDYERGLGWADRLESEAIRGRLQCILFIYLGRFRDAVGPAKNAVDADPGNSFNRVGWAV